MADEQKSKVDALALAEGASITAISAMLGFPVPPVLAANLITAASALITSALDLPTAWLQSKASEVRADGAAKAAVRSGAVPIALSTLTADDALAQRATLHLGGSMLRSQKNREAVVQEAVEELRASPPDQDATSAIDTDWLEQLGRLAETKSEPTVRSYFARVLAGEIRKPGTFSPLTIEVLARLTPRHAQLFRTLCNVCLEIIIPGIAEEAKVPPMMLLASYADPGTNSLAPLGLSFVDLVELEDVGLVRVEKTSRPMPLAALLTVPLRLGGRSLRFRSMNPDMDIEMRRDINTMNPTRAGAELLRIAHLEPHLEYTSRLLAWLKETFNVEVVPDELG